MSERSAGNLGVFSTAFLSFNSLQLVKRYLPCCNEKDNALDFSPLPVLYGAIFYTKNK